MLKSTLRIPSESMNSGAVVEVVSSARRYGRCDCSRRVRYPDGSDFDVDKLFFQFRANDNSKQDELFDMMVVSRDPAMLEQIMAPQGFDVTAAAKKLPNALCKQEQFIAATHTGGRTLCCDDNMVV